MNLNDLLRTKSLDPQHVLVFRHRPMEPELNKVLPWLAAEKPDVFNAYQQTQGGSKNHPLLLRTLISLHGMSNGGCMKRNRNMLAKYRPS